MIDESLKNLINTGVKTATNQNSKTAIVSIYANTIFNQYLRIHQTSDIDSRELLQTAINELHTLMEKHQLDEASQKKIRKGFLLKSKRLWDAAEKELLQFDYTPIDLLRIVKRYEQSTTKQ